MNKNSKGTATKKADDKNKATATTSKADVKNPNIKKVDDLSELKRQVEKLQKENESLKNGKLKLSFADAEKLYKRKAELLRQLAIYELKRNSFESLNITSDEEEILNAGNVRLSIEFNEGGYNGWKEIFKTSSKLILEEFTPFIIGKLNIKINELTAEVETIDI